MSWGIIGNVQQGLQGTRALLTRSGSAVVQGWVTDAGWSGSLDGFLLGSKAGKIILGRTGRLPLARTGRVGNFIISKLDGIGGPEPIIGADGIFSLEFIIIINDTFIVFIGDITGKSTDIGEFTLFAIRINVSVFTSGNTIYSTSFFPERLCLQSFSNSLFTKKKKKNLPEASIFSNVTKCEAAIFVSV